VTFIAIPNFAQIYTFHELNLGKLKENVYGPFLFNEKLYFSSDVKSSVFKSYKNQNGSNLYDIYSVNVDKWKLLDKPKNLGKQVNTFLSDGPLTFSVVDSSLYFTRALNLEDDYSNLGVFVAKLTNDSFATPKSFQYNNITYSVGHPSLNESSDVLVFASDMPGGKGKSDLYVCYFENESWSPPVSLGDSVNTSFKESFPFLHKNQLYFSSNRDGGFGGLDLYRCTYNGNYWTKPVLLDEPINSSANDFSIFLIDGMQEGYLSSNRADDGTDQIFYFSLDLPQPDSFISVEPNFCFDFNDELFTELRDVTYQWELGDGTTKVGNQVNHCFDRLGSYYVSLHITDNYIDFTYKNLYRDTLTIATDNYPYIDYKIIDQAYEFYIDLYSCDTNFDNHYWLVDGVVYYEDKLRLNKKVDQVKYVTWKTSSPENVLGIVKQL